MSEWAFRRAETDLSWNVRSGYFAVLVAQESIRANRALVSLTDEVYRVMVKQFRNGENAGYEPAQMGVFAEVSAHVADPVPQRLHAGLEKPGFRPRLARHAAHGAGRENRRSQDAQLPS